ncbi:MAG: adenylate/guanylate cyclase domain-containing protein [Myxococcales bacterium]|nr:adenylate/guanylate cyclase domain-containing protein [Myxococcales bacterium]
MDDSMSTPLLERALAHESLKSERLRTRIGVAMMGIAVVAITILMTIRRGDFVALLTRPEQRYAVLSLPVTLIVVIALYGRYVDRCIARGHLPRLSLRYAEALFEVTMITLAVLGFCVAFGATAGMLSPPTYIYPLLILLMTLSLDPRACAITGLAGALEYGALFLALQEPMQLEHPGSLLTTTTPYLVRVLMIALSGVLGALVAVELKRRSFAALRAAHEQTRLRQVFGQHVSPEVAQAILDAGDSALAPESRHVCVMFLDVRGFTKFSESRRPGEIMDYLGALLEPLMECVSEHGGIVNKLLGDGFMAIFGAPLPAECPEREAVAAALAQLEIVARLVDDGVIPPTRIGVGLHAGTAVTGNIGTARRKEYTVIGDTVNLAARVEAQTKAHGARLLVTETVVAALDASLRARAEDLGEVEIRGRAAPVRLYRLG